MARKEECSGHFPNGVRMSFFLVTITRMSALPGTASFYFVNGIGGKSKYDFLNIVEGSQVRYNEDYGAMLVEVSGFHQPSRFSN